MSAQKPEDFSELDGFVAVWGLPTMQGRIEKRLTSSLAELRAFHDAMLPRLPQIIDFLNQFPVNAIPAEYQPLANAALAMCDVDDPVNKWRSPVLDEALDPRRFTVKTSFYDASVPRQDWGTVR